MAGSFFVSELCDAYSRCKIVECSENQRQKMSAVAAVLRKQTNSLLPAHEEYQPQIESLPHFREAIAMKEFPEVVSWVKSVSSCEMFATLEDIEKMEEACRSNDRREFIVQCCMIFELLENSGISEEDFYDEDPTWLFGGCSTLEEIAYLFYRLRFVNRGSWLRVTIDEEMLAAVDDCLSSPSPMHWKGLLLVLRAAPLDSILHPRFLDRIHLMISDPTIKIPKAAATLFLSFITDAVHIDEYSTGRSAALGRELILKFLELKASPMVSTDAHPVLFKQLQKLHPEGWPEWLDDAFPAYGSPDRRPTAMNRILNLEWDDTSRAEIGKYVCCGVDAATVPGDGLPIVPKLQCLAARMTSPAQQLDGVTHAGRFLARLHRPLPLDECTVTPF